jgi:hypothetical protein
VYKGRKGEGKEGGEWYRSSDKWIGEKHIKENCKQEGINREKERN